MDPATVALLAAGIPAAVAAGTFAATHIIAAVSARRRRQVDAIALVMDALEAIPNEARLPRIIRFWRSPELPVAYAGMRLVSVLPKRDRILWEWLAVQTQELSEASRIAQVTKAAEMTGMLVAYIRSARRVRRVLKALESRGAWQRIK
jgi:hypothetical protein